MSENPRRWSLCWCAVLPILVLCGCGQGYTRGSPEIDSIVCVSIDIPYPKGRFIAVIGREFGHSYYVDGFGDTKIQMGDFLYNGENGELLGQDALRELLPIVGSTKKWERDQIEPGHARVRVLKNAGEVEEYKLPIDVHSPLFAWTELYIRDAYFASRRGTEHYIGEGNPGHTNPGQAPIEVSPPPSNPAP